jgi:hypothetical protein
MTEQEAREERRWETGWEGHALAQRRRMARLTMAEKLEWLESAQRLVFHLRRGARRAGGAEPKSTE